MKKEMKERNMREYGMRIRKKYILLLMESEVLLLRLIYA